MGPRTWGRTTWSTTHDLVNARPRAVAPDGVDHVFSAFSEGNVEAYAELLRASARRGGGHRRPGRAGPDAAEVQGADLALGVHVRPSAAPARGRLPARADSPRWPAWSTRAGCGRRRPPACRASPRPPCARRTAWSTPAVSSARSCSSAGDLDLTTRLVVGPARSTRSWSGFPPGPGPGYVRSRQAPSTRRPMPTQSARTPPVRFERLQTIPDELVDGFYALYTAAFEPLRVLAAARHVLTPTSSPRRWPTSGSTSTWPSTRPGRRSGSPRSPATCPRCRGSSRLTSPLGTPSTRSAARSST